MKVYVKLIAKRLGLLPIIQKYRSKIKEKNDARRQAKQFYERNDQFIKRHPNLPIPPIDLAYDAYGHVCWEDIFNMGKKDAQFISKLILKHAPTARTLLDWGCGPARILRHLTEYLSSEDVRLYGSDYNSQSIEWCKKHFKHIDFVENHLQPPLEFNENHFDVIYTISVLTHLSEKSHKEWIFELERVLKPKGILIITTHGDYYKSVLSTKELEQYEANQLVIRVGAEEGKRNFTAFHPPQFLKKTLFNHFEIIEHLPGPVTADYHFHQDFWVLRKI